MPISQEWSWLAQGTYILNGPTSNTFNYRATFAIQDRPFANLYPTFTVPALSVNVQVSRSKLFYADAARANTGLALAAAGLAALTTAVPFISAGFAATAAVFAVMATANAANAADPPEEDPNYKEIVEAKLIPIPKQFSDNSDLKSLASVTYALAYLSVVPAALGKIEGKILGAKKAGDPQYLEIQTSNYNSVVDSATRNVEKLSNEIGNVLQDIKQNGAFSSENIKKGLAMWKESGLPADVYSTMISSGLDDIDILNLRKLIDNPSITKQQIDFISTLEELVNSMIQATKAIKKK